MTTTPKRLKIPKSSVNAPFKSPLRSKSDPDQAGNLISTKSDDKNKQESYHEEIRHYIDLLFELKSYENNEIDLDKELERWREIMHKYNEAKDTCLILFGHLAHEKQCLVRQIYADYGMELTD